LQARRRLILVGLLSLLVIPSCVAAAPDQTPSPAPETDRSDSALQFRFGFENDRFNGTDDEHTSAFVLEGEYQGPEAAWGGVVLLESLTTRETRFHLDILSLLADHTRPVGRGRLKFIAGMQINGDLGSQKIENFLHRILGEGLLDFVYPDRYVVGVCGGARIDYPLAEAGPFHISGAAEGRLATHAGPSFIRGGVFAALPFRLWPGASLRPSFGVTAQDHFNLAEILKPYYGGSYSLDTEIVFQWGGLILDMFFKSDPYGNEQSMFGGGIAYRFH
jgi:hypothetical protein